MQVCLHAELARLLLAWTPEYVPCWEVSGAMRERESWQMYWQRGESRSLCLYYARYALWRGGERVWSAVVAAAKHARAAVPSYDIVGRFNGGANAGHTVVVGDKKFAFHLLPCGLVYPHTQNILGNGALSPATPCAPLP